MRSVAVLALSCLAMAASSCKPTVAEEDGVRIDCAQYDGQQRAQWEQRLERAEGKEKTSRLVMGRLNELSMQAKDLGRKIEPADAEKTESMLKRNAAQVAEAIEEQKLARGVLKHCKLKVWKNGELIDDPGQ